VRPPPGTAVHMNRIPKGFAAIGAAIVFSVACTTMRPAYAQSAGATETPIATDTPNAMETTAPSSTMTTTTAAQPFDYGWIGLVGLLGLFGLARRGTTTATSYTRTPPP
jgi:MYXO-CTERM domain-containing protein